MNFKALKFECLIQMYMLLCCRFHVGAVTWWEDYGAETPELQHLAIRILSQVCSSSALERLWSTFGHIHSKKRNRLGTQKADDLVFVNANLRLLTKMKHEYTHDKYIGFHKSEEDSGSIMGDVHEDAETQEEEPGEAHAEDELEDEPHEDETLSLE